MKIITLWEPHATLMAIGAKRIETRGWSADYRGPVAIHSAKGGISQSELVRTCLSEPFKTALLKSPNFSVWAEAWKRSSPNIRTAFYPGHILAVGKLIDSLPTESIGCIPGVFDDYRDLETDQERAFGNYGPGRYGLVFEDMVKLKTPIPFKSRQGKLLDLDEDTVVRVLADLAGRLGE